MKFAAIAVALALVGCHHPSATVWPKSAGNVAVPDWKDDGGQSLDPQATIVTDLEASTDTPAVAATDKSTATADSASATTPSSPPTPAGKGEVIFSDEIIIDLTNP